MIYSFQSPESIGRDIEKLELSAIIADREDWTEPVIDAAKRAGSAGVAISMKTPTVAIVEGLERRDESRRHAEVEPDVALQILTSGTTGPPKRQAIKTPVLERTVFSVTSGEKAPPDAPPEFAYWQFGGIGVCQLVAGVYNARRIVMLERFTVDGYVHAIKTHGINRSGVQPAVIRMLLDADVPKDDLASLDFLISASGPLDPETRDEFEAHFHIPVRLAYGATEFAGSLCAWTPDLIDEFGESKRNSVGRPLPDTQVRIVDPDTGAELPWASRGCWKRRWHRSAPTGSAPPISPRSTPTGSSRCTAEPTAPSTAEATPTLRPPRRRCSGCFDRGRRDTIARRAPVPARVTRSMRLGRRARSSPPDESGVVVMDGLNDRPLRASARAADTSWGSPRRTRWCFSPKAGAACPYARAFKRQVLPRPAGVLCREPRPHAR